MPRETNINDTQRQAQIQDPTQGLDVVARPVDTTVTPYVDTSAQRLMKSLGVFTETAKDLGNVAIKKETQDATLVKAADMMQKGRALTRQEIEQDTNMFVNIDEVAKQLNSTGAKLEASKEATSLKNKVDTDWNNMTNEERVLYGNSKANYYKQNFDNKASELFASARNVDDDYALKFISEMKTYDKQLTNDYLDEDAKIKKENWKIRSQALAGSTALSFDPTNKKKLYSDLDSLKAEAKLNGESEDGLIISFVEESVKQAQADFTGSISRLKEMYGFDMDNAKTNTERVNIANKYNDLAQKIYAEKVSKIDAIDGYKGASQDVLGYTATQRANARAKLADDFEIFQANQKETKAQQDVIYNRQVKNSLLNSNLSYEQMVTAYKQYTGQEVDASFENDAYTFATARDKVVNGYKNGIPLKSLQATEIDPKIKTAMEGIYSRMIETKSNALMGEVIKDPTALANPTSSATALFNNIAKDLAMNPDMSPEILKGEINKVMKADKYNMTGNQLKSLSGLIEAQNVADATYGIGDQISGKQQADYLRQVSNLQRSGIPLQEALIKADEWSKAPTDKKETITKDVNKKLDSKIGTGLFDGIDTIDLKALPRDVIERTRSALMISTYAKGEMPSDKEIVNIVKQSYNSAQIVKNENGGRDIDLRNSVFKNDADYKGFTDWAKKNNIITSGNIVPIVQPNGLIRYINDTGDGIKVINNLTGSYNKYQEGLAKAQTQKALTEAKKSEQAKTKENQLREQIRKGTSENIVGKITTGIMNLFK